LPVRDSNHVRKPRRGFHQSVQKLADSLIFRRPPQGEKCKRVPYGSFFFACPVPGRVVLFVAPNPRDPFTRKRP
jgi:hypothetical protein